MLGKRFAVGHRKGIRCPFCFSGYPFEVEIPAGLPVSGVVLADQVKSLDWQARKAEKIGRLPADVVDDVLAKLRALI